MPEFGGNGCGAIFLYTAHNLFEAETNEFYKLPSNSVILEFDYKTNNFFSFGFITGHGTAHELIFIKPNNNWNKIYFNLTPYVADVTTTDMFKIYINADLDRENQEAVILLDNIKLIHD